MKKVMYILLLFPLFVCGQQDTGIHFQNNLSWAAIKEKARLENKFIFMDCYASWCLPCKRMDKEVYVQKTVGDATNSQFVSVKVQMDTTKKDDAITKMWYRDAKDIAVAHEVSSFPTYLFFSPDGKIVHKATAFKRSTEFIKLIRDASDPSRQYYTLVRDYKAGKKNYDNMVYLATTARAFKENKLARTVGRDYINNYLIKRSQDEIFTESNLRFIGSYLTTVDKSALDLFLNHCKKIDSVVKLDDGRSYAKAVTESAIIKGEVLVKIYRDGDINRPLTSVPKWEKMRAQIKNKFGAQYSDIAILKAKITWFSSHKMRDSVIRCTIEKIEKYGLDTAGTMGKFRLNNIAWYDIFLHAKDSAILLKAAGWLEVLIKSPNFSSDPLYTTILDTYANLLYKAGHVSEALQWEHKAASLDKENEDIQKAFLKMKAGEPTW